MHFEIALTCTWEVKEAYLSRSGWVFDPSKGVWWLEAALIEDFVNERIAASSFGTSVDRFFFGFELINFSDGPRATKDYTSFRPKVNALISVGQLDWPSVKHLHATEQFMVFRQSLFDAINRIGAMTRKPRDFDYMRFLGVLEEILSPCDGSEFSAPLAWLAADT